MSSFTWVVVVLVALTGVVALTAAVLLVTLRRRSDQRRVVAEQLREQAGTQDEPIGATRGVVERAEEEARSKRVAADRAEQVAVAAEESAARMRRDLEVEEARQEDALREADRIDPDVEDDNEQYRPGKRRAATAVDSPSQSDDRPAPDDEARTPPPD